MDDLRLDDSAILLHPISIQNPDKSPESSFGAAQGASSRVLSLADRQLIPVVRPSNERVSLQLEKCSASRVPFVRSTNSQDPFGQLNHSGPFTFAPGEAVGFGQCDRPHSDVEILSYMVEGETHHTDSFGHDCTPNN